MKKSISCIGAGFVGGSLITVFSERGFDVFYYDKTDKVVAGGKRMFSRFNEEKQIEEFFSPSSVTDLVKISEQTKNFSGIYFICLPTPMLSTGAADLSIVEGVLKELSQIPGNRLAVVKSTVPPGSTERWNAMFAKTGLRVVFNPEFLTEANALEDMRNQNRIVLGGPRPYINNVKQLFQTAFPDIPIIKTSSTTAEMVKYFTNVHLAVRVILSCELYQICEALDKSGASIDYDKVKEYASYDKRLGGSHMNVPGNNGILGANGHCFPKDLNALISVAKQLDIKATVMESAWQKNLEVVAPEERDWERMVGRAVSKKDDK